MVMYATPTELAGFLQKDLDTYSATQALTLASADFSTAACTWFASQTATYTRAAEGCYSIYLPAHPVTAVTQVRLNGVVVTSAWTLIGDVVYSSSAFGASNGFPPDKLEIDYTFGYTTVPDDVKGAVLKMAGRQYQQPTPGVSMEQIDDYVVRYDGKPIYVSEDPTTVIARYRPVAVA
jgi:hypothetical protein